MYATWVNSNLSLAEEEMAGLGFWGHVQGEVYVRSGRESGLG